MKEYLEENGVELEENDDEWLGEFDYTGMSGWMYTVNGVLPNIGMSGYKPKDGDVFRLQFSTYGYGSGLGTQ